MPKKQSQYGQPAVYNASGVTFNDGDYAALQVDSNGNLLVAGGTGGGGVSAKYNVTPPVYTDGGTATLQTDVNGNLKVVSSGASGYTEGATTAPGVGGLSLGRYKSAAPTLTEGQMYAVQLDVSGNQKAAEQYIPYAEDNTNQVIAVIARPFISTAYERLPYNKFGTETKGLVKGSQSQLFSIRIDSLEATTLYYLQIKNKATAIADADVPDYSFPIAIATANGVTTLSIAKEFLGEAGKNFALGLTYGISSTKATFTTAGPTAANYNVHINYL